MRLKDGTIWFDPESVVGNNDDYGALYKAHHDMPLTTMEKYYLAGIVGNYIHLLGYDTRDGRKKLAMVRAAARSEKMGSF